MCGGDLEDVDRNYSQFVQHRYRTPPFVARAHTFRQSLCGGHGASFSRPGTVSIQLFTGQTVHNKSDSS